MGDGIYLDRRARAPLNYVMGALELNMNETTLKAVIPDWRPKP